VRPLYDLASVFADQIRTAETESSRVYEPVIGIVTDNKDPKKLGRVKLKIPVLSEQDSTDWSPIIMLGAGKNRGWFFIPEKDDEVLVMFEHGDMNRPLVVGALWNGKDKPPDSNPGGNPRRMIKSRAGSNITFDDDKEQLIIEDGSLKGRITLDAKANKITIEALDGDVCFQSPNGDMSIVATSVEMTATQNLEIHAGGAMQWGAGGSATIKSSATTLSGAHVNFNSGAAQMPAAPTTSPQDVPDPYEAGTSGGGSAATTRGNVTASQAAGGADTARNRSEGSNRSGDASRMSPPQEAPQPDNFTLWIKPEAINGGTLAGESLAIIDPATKEVVAEVEADADGHVLASVPENKPYDLQILGHADDVPLQPIGNDAVASSQIVFTLFDALGSRVEEGIEVRVRGMGQELTLTTGYAGTVVAMLDEGSYDIEVNGQKFQVDTLRGYDVQHEGGGPYALQLAPPADEPNYDEIDHGRQHRMTAQEREEMLGMLE